jgi:hypothetical protein
MYIHMKMSAHRCGATARASVLLWVCCGMGAVGRDTGAGRATVGAAAARAWARGRWPAAVVLARPPLLPPRELGLRGGMQLDEMDFYPYSEESISVSGSDSGRYWDENFHLPKDIPLGVLGGPRNLSDVIGDIKQRLHGAKVADNGTDSAHRHPYTFREDYEQLPPSHTLYIRNLRESVDPRRMRALLYAVFSQFGEVIYLRVLRTKTIRGQAFVCFKELSMAVTAKSEVPPPAASLARVPTTHVCPTITDVPGEMVHICTMGRSMGFHF